jgi:hypothetical protein
MGRRSRFVATRRTILKDLYYQWDHAEPICTWSEYRREHLDGINGTARLILPPSSMWVKQAATQKPNNCGGLNRATRRRLKKHQGEKRAAH